MKQIKQQVDHKQFLRMIQEEEIWEWLETAHCEEVYELTRFIEGHYRRNVVYRNQLLSRIDKQYFGIKRY